MLRQELKGKEEECPFNSVQVKIRKVSPERIRVTMEELRKEFVKEMSFKSGVEGRSSDG